MELKNHVKTAEHIAKILDNKFELFGMKFGIEPLIGLIPWIGDAIGLILSAYIVWISSRMRLPKDVIFTMYRNIIFDFLLGLVPVIGDVSDFIYKANSRNLKLLLKYKDEIIDGEIIDAGLRSDK